MNDLPFGFGESDDDADGKNGPNMDPFAALGGADLGQMLQQLGRMMSAGGDMDPYIVFSGQGVKIDAPDEQ